ncbi:MAG TPA: AAA family ATPase [Clostridiaceae bacterium]|nr:AAA family ATPase [Clostridiaceae bacterium]
MKIKRIIAEAFGVLRNREIIFDDKNIIIVTGRNEAGKSTLFNLVAGILYGFSPASVEKNPYVPWDNAFASLTSSIILQDGSEIQITRKLAGSITGKVVRGDMVEDIRNHPVPEVANLPMEIFYEIYALDMDSMNFPRSEAWQSVQDRLLGGQYASFLNPVAKVTSDIETYANQLWRGDRRGKPVAKEIEEKIRSLEAELKEAVNNEIFLRKDKVELLEKEKELVQKREEKARIIAMMSRLEELLPVKKQLEKAELLKKLAGKAEHLKHLPENPAQRLNEIHDRLKELTGIIEGNISREKYLYEKIQTFTKDNEVVLKNSDKIKVLIKAYDRIKADTEEHQRLCREACIYKNKLHSVWSRSFETKWNEEYMKDLESINPDRIRTAINNFTLLNNQYMNEYARMELLKEQVNRKKLPGFTPFVSIAVFLLGVAGVIKGNSVYPGLIAGLFSACLVLAWWFFNRKGQYDLKEYETKANKIKEQKDRILVELKTMLSGLPTPRERLDNPDMGLAVDLAELKEVAVCVTETGRRISDISARLDSDKNDINKVFDLIGKKPEFENLSDKINYLEICLEKSERLFRENEEALFEMKHLQDEQNSARKEYENLKEEMDAILEGLKEMEGNTPEEKSEAFIRQRRYLQSAESILDNLYGEHPGLDGMINDPDSFFNRYNTQIDEEAILSLKEEKEILEGRINTLMEEIGTLKKDIEYRIVRRSPADIQGETASLKDELGKVETERDRLVLLCNILKEADRTFREEHQPDVLKKAGTYLYIITSGSYDRLLLSEKEKDTMEVREAGSGKTREVSLLSRGTREQVYLALRLALVDHLDPVNERLPIFMDEVFVNWDGVRFKNSIDILKKLAENRQVFVFTCHDWMVERLESELDVQIIKM